MEERIRPFAKVWVLVSNDTHHIDREISDASPDNSPLSARRLALPDTGGDSWLLLAE